MNFQPNPNEPWGNIRYSQTYEASKLFGRKIYYCKASDIIDDKIFGEETYRKFLDENTYEMYSFRDDDTFFQGDDGFGGFGLIPTYSDIVYIPIKWFDDLNITPTEGDLILYDQTQGHHLFEITKVDTSTEAYGGNVINNRRFIHKLYLKLYERSTDDFDDDFQQLEDLDKLLDLEATQLDDISEDLRNTVDQSNVVTKDDPFGEM